MDPLLLDIPDEFESERLTIRAPRWGDGAEVNAAILESLAELQPWMPWANPAPTVEESEAGCRRARLRFLAREDMRLQLYLKGTATLVGSSGLHRINWGVPRFEIGYWVRARFARQGYITEAVNATTRFAFDVLGAQRVEIRMDDRNVASYRVAERAGYMLEGTLRCDSRAVDGTLRSTRVYSKIAPHPV